MPQIFQFVTNHWLLWGLFAIIFLAILWLELRNNVGGIFKIEPQQTVDLMNHQQALVLDIRDQSAYTSGHILHALNVPINEIENKAKKLQKYKTMPIILVGSQDNAAVQAGATLKKLGFEKLYAMKGGLGAWRSANLPLVSN